MSKIDYKFLVYSCIESYMSYHNEEEIIEFINNMIEKKHIPILSKDLKVIGRNQISLHASRYVIDYINRKDKKYDLTPCLSTILKRNLQTVNNKRKRTKKKSKFSLKRLCPIGIAVILSTSISSPIEVGNEITIEKNESFKTGSSYDTDDIDITNTDYDELSLSAGAGVENMLINMDLFIEKEKELEQEKEIKKQKILNSFKKCKTLDDILKRQKQLKSLGLTKNDKIYKDCPLSPEIQRFIYEQSIIYGLPVDFTFSIIYTETRGEFNSSGTSSYNAPNDCDLGLTQQNTVSSVKMFADLYNLDKSDAEFYVRYNDFVNVVSAFNEYEEIKKFVGSYDPEEYAGCYNGWVNWKNKKISREYVEIFNDAYNDEFKDYHKIIKKK